MDAPDGVRPRQVGGEVVFARASGGSDLVYEVTTDSVKETIMLRGPPGEKGLTAWSEDPAGLAGVLEPNDTNGRYLLEQVDGRWKLTVSVERDWLNRKDIVYPVRVDPTVATPGYDAVWATKSDNTVIQDGYPRIGSPNSAGSIWRGFIHYDWSGLLNAGNQIVDADLAMGGVVAGTVNSYPSSVNHSTGVNYHGIGEELGSEYFGSDVTTVTTGWSRSCGGCSRPTIRIRCSCSAGMRSGRCTRTRSSPAPCI